MVLPLLVGQPKINCLKETRDGILWIGTDRDGLFGLKDGKLRHLTFTNGLPDNHIMALEEDGHGVLWIGSDGGLTQFGDGKPTRIFEKKLNSPVQSLACDVTGRMYVGINNNVLFVESNRLAVLPVLSQIEFHGPAYCLLTKPTGDIMIAVAYGLLEIKVPSAKLFTRIVFPLRLGA